VLLVLLVLLVMLVVLLIGMDLDVVRTNQRHLWWKVVVGVVMVMGRVKLLPGLGGWVGQDYRSVAQRKNRQIEEQYEIFKLHATI